MPRGGARQGTPGKGYSNRTDLQARPDMEQNTAGTGGGVTASNEAMRPASRTPDDSPMLLSPTGRPDEPITAGLSVGPGGGPEMLGTDPRMQETQTMKKWLPLLKPIIDEPDTPESVKMLFRYMRGA